MRQSIPPKQNKILHILNEKALKKKVRDKRQLMNGYIQTRWQFFFFFLLSLGGLSPLARHYSFISLVRVGFQQKLDNLSHLNSWRRKVRAFVLIYDEIFEWHDVTTIVRASAISGEMHFKKKSLSYSCWLFATGKLKNKKCIADFAPPFN